VEVVTRVLIGDLLTGRRILDIPYSKLSWSVSRNAAESISLTVPLTSRLVRRLDLRNATTPAKTFMAVLLDDVPIAAGPIWRRQYAKATGLLDLAAAGMWSYFDHRHIIPALAASQGVVDPVTGESINDTVLTNLSYGTIAKRIVQQARTWTGGNVPIVFQDDEAGTYTRTYLGATLKKVGEALADFIDLRNGIDIRFQPRFTSDRLGIEWVLQTGTLTQPYLRSPQVHRWDYTVPKPSIRNLSEVEDASRMAGLAWFTSGRQEGTALAVQSSDGVLAGAGYPLLELADASHSDVTIEATLQEYADNAILLGRAPMSAWSFEAKASGSPRAGQYWPGDLAEILVGDDPWLGNRWGTTVPTDLLPAPDLYPSDDLLPDGGSFYFPPKPVTHVREIASISGDEKSRWVSVVTEEQIEVS